MIIVDRDVVRPPALGVLIGAAVTIGSLLAIVRADRVARSALSRVGEVVAYLGIACGFAVAIVGLSGGDARLVALVWIFAMVFTVVVVWIVILVDLAMKRVSQDRDGAVRYEK